MKIYPLDLGYLDMQKGNDVFADGRPGHIPICAYLFDTDAGWILFDTGADPEGMSGHYPAIMREQATVTGPHDLLDELARVGISPADVSTVVMSHLHLDHSGGLRFLPKAKAYVAKAEFEAAKKAFNDPYLVLSPYIKFDFQSWIDADIRWRLVEEDQREIQLAKGLKLVNLGPGHSFCDLALEATLEDGEVYLFVSDAIYSEEHIKSDLVVPQNTTVKEVYPLEVESILAHARENGTKVIFGHDAQQFRQLLDVSPL